ncbi:hypothetical protein [Oceanobacillus massiliensis]|uniref:hypothetical protein n=1 Tax=Oceanobacillus massiliensis TaxID=1465765 RepID=UPI0030181D53
MKLDNSDIPNKFSNRTLVELCKGLEKAADRKKEILTTDENLRDVSNEIMRRIQAFMYLKKYMKLVDEDLHILFDTPKPTDKDINLAYETLNFRI